MAEEIYQVKDFDRRSIDNLYNHLNENQFFVVWSDIEIELLKEISPMTVKTINQNTNSNYEVRFENLEEQAKSIAAYLISTIDNSIFKGIMRPNMVKSKIRNLNKLYVALGEECPISQNDVTNDNFIDYAFKIKDFALSIAKRYQKIFTETQKLEPQTQLTFVNFFTELFGENLETIIQYGSSVDGGGKDIDLRLLLKQFDKGIYNLINGKRNEVQSEKPVGIVLLPSNLLTAYAECDSNSLTIAREGKLIYGDSLDFPVFSEEESIRKTYVKAGKDLTTLRGALGNLGMQKALVKSSDFLIDTLKLEIWISKALLQKELGEYLSKEEFLKREPIQIENLKEPYSLMDVQRVLYNANCRIKNRIENHFYVIKS